MDVFLYWGSIWMDVFLHWGSIWMDVFFRNSSWTHLPKFTQNVHMYVKT